MSSDRVPRPWLAAQRSTPTSHRQTLERKLCTPSTVVQGCYCIRDPLPTPSAIPHVTGDLWFTLAGRNTRRIHIEVGMVTVISHLHFTLHIYTSHFILILHTSHLHFIFHIYTSYFTFTFHISHLHFTLHINTSHIIFIIHTSHLHFTLHIYTLDLNPVVCGRNVMWPSSLVSKNRWWKWVGWQQVRTSQLCDYIG